VSAAARTSPAGKLQARKLQARPALSYQEVLALDPRPAPSMLGERTADLGLEPVAASRYTSAAFFREEIAKVWLRTWQYVCREEDVPEPGDTHVYDLLDKTLIIVRQADGTLKALQNVCLHRGRKLVTLSGCKQQFRCPYHGLTWNTDGSFRENPFGWDFPQIDPEDFALPQVRLESWAGFVFVNFDREASPLLEQLAPMPEHFAHWKIEDCYRVAHVGKIAPANWKACAEAFIEAHHVFTTHPQLNPTNGYESGQYDVLSEHVTRFINPGGLTPSIHPEPLTEAQRIAFIARGGQRAGGQSDLAPEPGMTARNFAAEASRRRLEAATGYDFSGLNDAELVDSFAYDFFPNFHLWGGFADKICYRFRPVGLDHERTLIEVMLYRIAPKGQPKPAPAAYRFLGEDELWSSAEELGFLAGVYDQDQSNLGPVQQGLRALGEGTIQFSRYLEVRCRHLHQTIDAYMRR